MPAKSEKQRKFFGAVMGAKKGQKGVTGAAKEVAGEMTKKEIKKFLKKESFNDVFEALLEAKPYWEPDIREQEGYKEVQDQEEINQLDIDNEITTTYMDETSSKPQEFTAVRNQDGTFSFYFGKSFTLSNIPKDSVKKILDAIDGVYFR